MSRLLAIALLCACAASAVAQDTTYYMRYVLRSVNDVQARYRLGITNGVGGTNTYYVTNNYSLTNTYSLTNQYLVTNFSSLKLYLWLYLVKACFMGIL